MAVKENLTKTVRKASSRDNDEVTFISPMNVCSSTVKRTSMKSRSDSASNPWVQMARQPDLIVMVRRGKNALKVSEHVRERLAGPDRGGPAR